MGDITDHKPEPSKDDKDKKTKADNGLPFCSPADSFVDVTAMIRSLQRADGHADCFRTGIMDCDKTDCPWRIYCLDDSPGFADC